MVSHFYLHSGTSHFGRPCHSYRRRFLRSLHLENLPCASIAGRDFCLTQPRGSSRSSYGLKFLRSWLKMQCSAPNLRILLIASRVRPFFASNWATILYDQMTSEDNLRAQALSVWTCSHVGIRIATIFPYNLGSQQQIRKLRFAILFLPLYRWKRL